MPKTAVEDLFMKRDLLNRYRKNWEAQLESCDLRPAQRAKIVEEIRLLGSIDEDLLRLERQLQGQRLEADLPAEATAQTSDNDSLRQAIMQTLHGAAAVVSTEALCTAHGIDKPKLRNVMRTLLKNHAAASVGTGYRALMQGTAIGADLEHRERVS